MAFRWVLWTILLGSFFPPHVRAAEIAFAGRITSPVVGDQLTSGARDPSISPDGRYVAFVSSSSNMGPTSNGSLNVYRYDLQTDVYELAVEQLGTGNSFAPSISEDGLGIAFPSESNDLVADTQSSSTDIFYSRAIPVGPNVSFDTSLVSRGVGGVAAEGASQYASISANGRWIAFYSTATNLINGDTNVAPDIFVADAQNLASLPVRVSVTSGGAQILGPSRALSPSAISNDGRYVVFAVDTPVSIDGSNAGTLEDVFVRDRVANTTSLISKSSAGVAGSSSSDNASISPNGRFVVFRSFSTNLVAVSTGSRIYLRDRQTAVTFNMPLPQGAASCEDPRVSDSAQIVAQCNMNAGGVQAQVFRYEPSEDAFYQLSTSVTETNANSNSGDFISISADGAFTVFDSAASDLVANDTNSSTDVFLVLPEPAAAGSALAAIATLAAIARRRIRRGVA